MDVSQQQELLETAQSEVMAVLDILSSVSSKGGHAKPTVAQLNEMVYRLERAARRHKRLQLHLRTEAAGLSDAAYWRSCVQPEEAA